MSTLIKFDFKELKQLASDKQSCIVEKTVTQNLALESWCLGNLKESIKNVMDYKIGKFIKELNGILISFKNLRILQNVGAIRNDNSEINFQVQADYFIFQPYVGAILKGVVSKKTVTHLVVLLYGVFNVVIPRPTEEHRNSWIGSNIQENQEVLFRIVVLDLYGALPYIRGELDERWIKFEQESDDKAGVLNPNKTINVSYEQQNSEIPMSPSAQNYNGPYKVSTKNNPPHDNNSLYQRQTAGEVEINLRNIKGKNKRHKDLTPKYGNSDIKQTDPKLKHKTHGGG